MKRGILTCLFFMHFFCHGMWRLQPEIEYFKQKLAMQKVCIDCNDLIIAFSSDKEVIDSAKKKNEELKKSNEELEYKIKTGYRD